MGADNKLRLKFLVSTCLVFGLAWPPALLVVEQIALVFAGRANWAPEWLVLKLWLAYSGVGEVLLHGLLCGAGLLLAMQMLRKHSPEPGAMLIGVSAQLVGITSVVLLEGPQLWIRANHMTRSDRSIWETVKNLWSYEMGGGTSLIGLWPLFFRHLLPSLVCISIVAWCLLPKQTVAHRRAN